MSALYVFNVNRGYIVSLDVAITGKHVKVLHDMLADATGVSVNDQVLLTPNGTAVEPEKRVAYYTDAGTHQKPFFLFIRKQKADKTDYTSKRQRDDLNSEISTCMHEGERLMTQVSGDRYDQYPHLVEHVQQCIKIGERIYQSAISISQEHSYISAGWTALVTNLTLSHSRLQRKEKRFESHVIKFEELKKYAAEFVEGFDSSVEQLKKLKLPPCLQPSEGGAAEMTLFDWITASDPHHSLEDLLLTVQDQMGVVLQMDVISIRKAITQANETLRKKDHLEIKGINKRISQLDHTLELIQKLNQDLEGQASHVGNYHPSGMERRALMEMLQKSVSATSSIHDTIRRMQDQTKTYYNSKEEVLDNVRSRLFGIIVTAYERIHYFNTHASIFEQKFTGLKQRMDLVRQVRESPMMFATCITEIMRRKKLQTEFNAWHQQHTQKCKQFSDEENEIRTMFSSKLEKHFLRVMFKGMFDKLPVFFVKAVPEFDRMLPNIDSGYYRELRVMLNAGAIEAASFDERSEEEGEEGKTCKEIVECSAGVMKVNSPQVFVRLSGGARPTSLHMNPVLGLRREESFVVQAGHDTVMSNLHKALPSTAWLSDEGMMECSPSQDQAPAMLISPGEGRGMQCRPPSLQDIEGLVEENVSRSVKSAPIPISTALAAGRVGGPSTIRETGESRFSSEEDELRDSKEDKEQFAIDDISSRSQVMEVLRPMVQELQSLKGELASTKNELFLYKDFHDIQVEEGLRKADKMLCEVLTQKDAAHAKIVAEMAEKIAALEAKAAEKEKENTTVKAKATDEIARLTALIQENQSKITELTAKVEESESKRHEESQEIFKKLTIEYELEKDKDATMYQATIEEKDDALRYMQKDLEKKNAEIDKLKSGPEADEFRKIIETEVRANLEQEFKKRAELFSKSVEFKKEEAVARWKKDIEFEMRKKNNDINVELACAKFEAELLRTLIDHPAQAIFRTTDAITEHVALEMGKLINAHQFSNIFTSPMSSPRKAELMDSLHVSITSLTSPLPESPDEQRARADSKQLDSRPGSAEMTTSTILPVEKKAKIIPPPEHKEESMPASDSSSSLHGEEEDRTPRKEASEKRGEKRRSSERVEAESKKTMALMEESFIPDQMPRKKQESANSTEEMLLDEISDSAAVVEASGAVSVSLQTRLNARAMDYMVSLSDIREGSSVLIVWDDRHNAYILFCFSNHIHFVKETSVRRLGLAVVDENNPRKNWILARVAHLDLCIIKKPTNRYKLPVETTVYRVDVNAFPMDPNMVASALR